MERRRELAELITVSDVPFDVVADSRAGWDVEFIQVEAGSNPTMLRQLELDGMESDQAELPFPTISYAESGRIAATSSSAW